ncbi:MFS transporter [Alkalibacterium sp. 20]|uniref:MFS transporter n=1 Tax=Alkalibacterium sp. 20 TaxID=1798803 RepID=UPI00090006EF|nr:MFS transporter [Alkalibacterium sp. 20]OJF94178.1 MFS transporter [Alkalibacterium sp. 20]
MKKKELPFYYGWVIVAVGALSVFFSSPGQTFSVSIFIDFYIEEFGWSRSQISSFYSIATLVSGLSMPFVGDIIDKQGHRKATVIVAGLFGATLLWMSAIRAPWMILIGFLFIRMFGQGSLTLIPSVLIPQWFEKKRGRALSLISIGGVIGSALVPPLNNFLIQTYGLSIAWLFWAGLMLLVMLPAAALLIRNRPEDMGLQLDGVKPFESDETQRSSNEELVKKEKVKAWTLQEVKKTRTFWFLMYSSVVPALVNTAMVFHMVSIISGKGHNTAFAAYLLSTIALVQMGMTFVAGFVLEKVKVNIVKAWSFVLYVVVILLLTYAEHASLLIVFAVFQGIFIAFDGVSSNIIWADYYGRANLGKIRGVAMSAMVIGSALGPLPYGIAFDVLGGYKEILLASLILPILASIAMFISPAPTIADKKALGAE